MDLHLKRYLVEPGRRMRLREFEPGDAGPFADKDEAKEGLEKDLATIAKLQERLYAEGRRSLLIVLQGMDTSGKDGAIERVMETVNPQGCEVTSFKAPNSRELSHDFLWRVHRRVPAKGMIGIFNRSHYEDVLIVRVKQLVPESVWSKRFRQINDFERQLVESGTTVLKFFLHISKEEQRDRLQARLDDPKKHWKFNPDDLKERARWDDYMKAYEDALNKCSTEWAPWHVVPSDRKWYRNRVLARVVAATLKDMAPKFPAPKFDPAKIVIDPEPPAPEPAAPASAEHAPENGPVARPVQLEKKDSLPSP